MFFSYQNSTFLPRLSAAELGRQHLRYAHDLLIQYSCVNVKIRIHNYEDVAIANEFGEIELDRAFLKYSFPTIAGILAHEYGHIVLRQDVAEGVTSIRQISPYQDELQADVYAAVFMALNGISIEGLIDFIFESGFEGKSQIHLEPTHRAEVLRFHYDFARCHLYGAPSEVLEDYAIQAGRDETLHHTQYPERYNEPLDKRLKI